MSNIKYIAVDCTFWMEKQTEGRVVQMEQIMESNLPGFKIEGDSCYIALIRGILSAFYPKIEKQEGCTPQLARKKRALVHPTDFAADGEEERKNVSTAEKNKIRRRRIKKKNKVEEQLQYLRSFP